MGNTTIIELNHDHSEQIENNPELFIRIVLEHLASGDKLGNQIPGGRIIACFNRDGSSIDNSWEDWKKKFFYGRY